MNEQEFECGVHIEVPVDFAVCTDGKRYDIDKPIELVECVGGETLTTSAQLVSFTATPFSSELYLTLDTSDYEKGDGPYIKLSVELADGTAIIHDVIYRITDGAVSCRSVFAEPTDPEKIVAVTVNENTFELY